MDSARYFSFTAALIFLAVCAYSAAALYSRVERPEIETVSLLHLQESAQLQGIVLRREQGLSFGWGTRLLAEDSRRLAAGETMAVDLMGRELLSPCSAVFFESSDGFEDLDPREIDAEDVSALESLLDRKAGDKADARLVTDTAWYYWALCSSKDHLPGSGLCSVQFQGMEESVQARDHLPVGDRGRQKGRPAAPDPGRQRIPQPQKDRRKAPLLPAQRPLPPRGGHQTGARRQ